MRFTCWYAPGAGGEWRKIAFKEDYKIVKKILDWLGIYEFGKKRAPPRIDAAPDDFDEYIIDDFIDCDHVRIVIRLQDSG